MIDKLIDPKNYIGLCKKFAEDQGSYAKKLSKKIKKKK